MSFEVIELKIWMTKFAKGKRLCVEGNLKTGAEVIMKKLALFVITIAFAPLMYASMASAQVVGTYEMVATGSCLHSPSGFQNLSSTPPSFSPPFIPNSPVGVWGATTMAKATWVFRSNGTGFANGTNYPIDFPPGGVLGLGTPAARENPISFKFNYQLDEDDIILQLYHPVTNAFIGELLGEVSVDKKTMTIPSAYQVYNFGTTLGYAVCNTARILIQVESGNEPVKK